MKNVKKAFSFTLLAVSLVTFAPAAFAETAHSCHKAPSVPKVLNDPRVPITFGSLALVNEGARAAVRIPQPRRR